MMLRARYARPMERQELALQARLDELSQLITRFAASDGIHESAIGGVGFARASAPSERFHGVSEPCVCVIAQGSKRVMLGDDVYIYDRANYLAVSHDLPVVGQVVDATLERPFLGFKMNLDPKEIAALLLEADLPRSVEPPGRGLYVSRITSELLDAVVRLLRLLETPEDIPALAPLARREIIYRMLKGDEGHRLRQMATLHSHARRIAVTLDWLRSHFAEPLRVEDLAAQANMSPSSFHEHFRAVTAMSPLQYQKQLRLQEARRLLLSEALDAAAAGHRVGYESPSQFSREYSRLFGAPPAADARRLRVSVEGAA